MTTQRNRTEVRSTAYIPVKELPSMLTRLWSEDGDSQLQATQFFRKLIARSSPPIIGVVNMGVVPRFVKFLSNDDFPALQYEAAHVLTMFAVSTLEYKRLVVGFGAVPIFIRLLTSPSEDVRLQSAWALGGLAAKSPELRDFILNHNALSPLLSLFDDLTTLTMLKIVTWTLSNFCKGKPPPSFEQIKPALPFLERLLPSTDADVLTRVCISLSCISGLSNKAVIDPRVIPRLIELLSHSSPKVLLPALRTIRYILGACHDDLTQTVLDHQVLPPLMNLLRSSDQKSIKKEACWVISHIITAGNPNQIQAVIEAGIIPSLVLLLQTAELEVKKEAASGISNAISSGTRDQIKFMVREGCIKPICDLLTCPNPRIIEVCLDAIQNILVVGEAEKKNTEGDNLYATMIDEAQGLEKIENLQNHANNYIYKKALAILETFWRQW